MITYLESLTSPLATRAVQGRTAANTAHTLLYDVVVHKGIPLRFHSDAAKEFLSTAMSTLQNLLGIRKTDTLAHNPKSNAKIERVWEFVGRSLRAMTPEQYTQFHLYTPIIAHVWNCTPDSDTGITPFQAEHGMSCRSVAESLVENPPAEGLPATACDLRSIAIAASAFNEVISNIKAYERANAANNLNAYGQPLREFAVGDRVTFYLPPSQAEAEKMGKNPKQCSNTRGLALLQKHCPTTILHLRLNAIIALTKGISCISPNTPPTSVYLPTCNYTSITHTMLEAMSQYSTTRTMCIIT